MKSNSDPTPAEDVLRDYLAGHLELIEDNLQLIDVEFRLKNTQGAGGKIDILARSHGGNLVVIELKRSEQSARQALHELEKYVALLAVDKGKRTDQVRCILISTTWHELLVPFARFARHVDYQADARQLHLHEDGTPASTTLIRLPDTNDELELFPMQMILLFENRDKRDRHLPDVGPALNTVPVTDFFAVASNYIGHNSAVIYRYAITVGIGIFNDHQRMVVEHTNTEEFPEFNEDVEDYSHEQFAFIALLRHCTHDTAESSNSDRFRSMTDWCHSAFVRGGRFSDSDIWTDQSLIDYASGIGEKVSSLYEKQATPRHRSNWLRTCDDVSRCLDSIPEWQTISNALMSQFEKDIDCVVEIKIYNPRDIIFGLDHLSRYGDRSYIPELVIKYRSGSTIRRYVGAPVWDLTTKPKSLSDTLGQTFGDFESYAFARSLGGLWLAEADLARLHGLRYRVGSEELRGSDAVYSEWSVGPMGDLRNQTSTTPPFDTEGYIPFLAANRDYFNELNMEFDSKTIRPV